jgi:predicted nuclease with RNAse H fold
MRWAGVDVGGTRKGFDVAVIESRGSELHLSGLPRRFPDVAGVVAMVLETTPSVVAVDSPIRAARPGSLSREGERELARNVCGIRYTPDRATLEANPTYYGWILNGFRLYAALDGLLLPMNVIECFPTASWTRLGGIRGTLRRAAWTRTVLYERLVERGPLRGVPLRHNQDARDAIVAALTAYLHDQGKTEAFGDLVVPASHQKGDRG